MSYNKDEPKKIEVLFKELTSEDKQSFSKPIEELDIPKKPGVYIIYDLNNEVVHVGRTRTHTLTQRFTDHLRRKSSFTRNSHHKPKKLKPGYLFQCLTVESPRIRGLLEHYAQGRLCPEYFEGL